MASNTDPYVALITSEHDDKPNFIATVRTLTQGFADVNAVCNTFPTVYNLDVAVATQLDAIGLWIGLSRILSIPLANVYFSWDDTELLGWDSGSWQGPGDSSSGLISLPDDSYRNLLRSKIAANNWDGTIPGALAVYQAIFAGAEQVIIQDNQDMSFIVGFVGAPLTAIDQALLTNGYIPLKPSGVRIAAVAVPVAPGPLFAWDVTSSTLNGWDVGQWPVLITL